MTAIKRILSIDDQASICQMIQFTMSDMSDDNEDEIIVKDSNGTRLADRDSVTLIKDLKVKGTSVTLKRGTLVKGIHLTDDEEEVECRVEKVKGLVLKTCFLKKV